MLCYRHAFCVTDACYITDLWHYRHVCRGTCMCIVLHTSVLCYRRVTVQMCATLYTCGGIDCCDTCMAVMLHTCVLCYMFCLTNVCCVKCVVIHAWLLCYIHVYVMFCAKDISLMLQTCLLCYRPCVLCFRPCVLCYRPCAAVTTYTAVRLARYVMWPRQRAPRVPSACPGRRRHLP